MIISKSNTLKNAVVTIITGAGSDNIDNIISPDFSANYVAAGSVLEISFGAVLGAFYVAVGGHNAAGGTIQLLDGAALIQTVNLSRNNTVIFSGHTEDFTDLRVRLTTAGSNAVVSYIAGGESFNVPNGGEQSGYSRGWLSRPISQKTTTNSLGEPVATLNKRKPLKGSLTIPHASTIFSRGTWQDFFDFITSEPFFVKEVDSLEISSYVCFSPKFNAPRAHGATRALDSLSISFQLSNGL